MEINHVCSNLVTAFKLGINGAVTGTGSVFVFSMAETLIQSIYVLSGGSHKILM